MNYKDSMSVNKFKLYLQTLTSSTTSVEYLLKKILTVFLKEGDRVYMRENMLAGIRSKDISKLVSLLESEDQRVRKMTIVIISLILSNPLAKIIFMEKCGLSLIPGKVFLTRLKYLSKNVSPTGFISLLLSLEKGQESEARNSHSLFWYIPMAALATDSKKSQLEYHFFEEYMLRQDEVGDFQLDSIPDPIFNICGFHASSSALEKNHLLANVPREDEDSFTFESHYSTRQKDYEINTQIFSSSIRPTPQDRPEKQLVQSLVIGHSANPEPRERRTRTPLTPSRSPLASESRTPRSPRPEAKAHHSVNESSLNYRDRAPPSKSPVRNYGPIQRRADVSKSPVKSAVANVREKSPVRFYASRN